MKLLTAFFTLSLLISKPCFANDIEDLKSIVSIMQMQIAELKAANVTLSESNATMRQSLDSGLKAEHDFVVNEVINRLASGDYKGERFRVWAADVRTPSIVFPSGAIIKNEGADLWLRSRRGGEMWLGDGVGLRAAGYFMVQQPDGNFVLYKNYWNSPIPLWSSGTDGR